MECLWPLVALSTKSARAQELQPADPIDVYNDNRDSNIYGNQLKLLYPWSRNIYLNEFINY